MVFWRSFAAEDIREMRSCWKGDKRSREYFFLSIKMTVAMAYLYTNRKDPVERKN